MLLGIDGMVFCSTHFAPRTFHRSNSSHGQLPAQTVELSESKREVSAPVEGGLDHRDEQVIYCARDCDHDSGVLAAGPITMLSNAVFERLQQHLSSSTRPGAGSSTTGSRTRSRPGSGARSARSRAPAIQFHGCESLVESPRSFGSFH